MNPLVIKKSVIDFLVEYMGVHLTWRDYKQGLIMIKTVFSYCIGSHDFCFYDHFYSMGC